MTEAKPSGLSGLSRDEKHDLLKRMMEKQGAGGGKEESVAPSSPSAELPKSFYQFEHFPEYEQLRNQLLAAKQAGIENPFFRVHDRVARDTTRVDGRELLNFSTYNYVGLNGDPRVCEAAVQAMRRYGTSASASRLVSGERPPHRELERGLAEFLDTQDCLTFVSGHTTNASTVSAIAGPKDLILYDRLIHNSILQGALASGAQRLAFPHNDMERLDEILRERRRMHQKVLIVVEGIYSMDGDMAPLPDLVAIKNRHKAILMVDEAHSIGVAGKTGRGVTEHFGVPSSEVDILMGTLSKSLASCGGYIAGSHALIELLKFTASGFVYSVGMPPPMAAAAKAALDLLRSEPDRLWRNVSQMKNGLSAIGVTNESRSPIIPIIIGNSVAAGRISNALFRGGINVQPIIFPVVEERVARLRFFLSSEHSFKQIEEGLRATAEQLALIGV